MGNSKLILRFLVPVISFIRAAITKCKQVCGERQYTEMTVSQPIITSRHYLYLTLMVNEKIIGQRRKREKHVFVG